MTGLPDAGTDPALPVTGLTTLQFSWGGLFDHQPADNWTVHLVRSTNRGTPGPTLCGVDRFAEDSPGWCVGGGSSGPGIEHPSCAGCVEVAVRDFGDLPIGGSVGAVEIRAAVGAARAYLTGAGG